MKLHREFLKLYNNKLEKKLIFQGISTDIFDALKVLYNNIDFQKISDSATKKNNYLIFKDYEIIFKNYKYKRFKSNEANPCFNINDITLTIKHSAYTDTTKHFPQKCLDIKLLIT